MYIFPLKCLIFIINDLDLDISNVTFDPIGFKIILNDSSFHRNWFGIILWCSKDMINPQKYEFPLKSGIFQHNMKNGAFLSPHQKSRVSSTLFVIS